MSRFFVLILGIVAGYVAFNFGSRIRQNVSGLLERENDSEDGEPKNGGSGSARVSKGADDGSVREPKGANDGSAGESQKSSANKLFGSQSQPLTLAESIRRKIAEAQAEEAKAEADAQSGEARKKSDD